MSWGTGRGICFMRGSEQKNGSAKIFTMTGNKIPSRDFIPPWEKENHLQNAILGKENHLQNAILGGYLSSLEDTPLQLIPSNLFPNETFFFPNHNMFVFIGGNKTKYRFYTVLTMCSKCGNNKNDNNNTICRSVFWFFWGLGPFCYLKIFQPIHKQIHQEPFSSTPPSGRIWTHLMAHVPWGHVTPKGGLRKHVSYGEIEGIMEAISKKQDI